MCCEACTDDIPIRKGGNSIGDAPGNVQVVVLGFVPHVVPGIVLVVGLWSKKRNARLEPPVELCE